jgi:XapX domain-containing protein
MFQFASGIVMAFGIGAFCRWFDIPSPAPPRLVGALLVIAMTVGFLLTGHLLAGS